MKAAKLLLAVFFACTSLGLLAQSKGKSKQKQRSAQSVKENEGRKFYTCSMHPDIMEDHPGKCSKCGMDLVVSENGKGKALGKHKHDEHAKYLCPMHPDVTAEQPGKCSKCGMDLVKNKKLEGGKEKKEKHHQYVCPMHPEVTAEQPGKCSKCGMALKEKEEKHD